MADDNDDKLKIALRDIPAPDDRAVHRASDAAWDTLQDARYRKRYGFSGSPLLASCVILIAVFGTLSYAVTQSTRSGAGDTASETNLISSGQLTQYPAGIRTSVVRMIIGGLTVEQLLFNSPADFDSSAFQYPEIRARAVFHPAGGNATYQRAPLDVMAGGNGTWYFNAEVQIPNIGLTGHENAGGNDVVAFLPNVTSGICRRINEELGIPSHPLPVVTGVPRETFYTNMDTDYRFPQTAGRMLDEKSFIGQPFGCFRWGDTDLNVYYHVIIER